MGRMDHFLLNSLVPLSSFFIPETIICDVTIGLGACLPLLEHKLFKDGLFFFAHLESERVSEAW